MDKHFTFYAGSWWDSVCDCCEPTKMEYHNSDDTDGSLGSAQSEEDCYAQAIVTVLGRDNLVTEEEDLSHIFHYLDLDQLIRIADNIGIVVEIVEEEG